MAPESIQLHYFAFPGRGEAARLILTLGGIQFEDVRVSMDEWPKLKPRMPFGQVPVLEVDGQMLPQMAAIDRYCATLAGMLPEGDPLQVAQAEAVYCLIADVWEPVGAAMMTQRSDAPDETKEAAWSKVLAPEGPFKTRLGYLDKALAERQDGFISGDKLSFIDLSVFGTISLFKSGWLERLPRDLLSPYPAIRAFRHKVASVPGVAAFYAKESDELRVAGYRPDADGGSDGVAAQAPAGKA